MNYDIKPGMIPPKSAALRLVDRLRWKSIFAPENNTFPFANIAIPNDNTILISLALAGYDHTRLQVYFDEIDLMIVGSDSAFDDFKPRDPDPLEEKYVVHNIREGGFLRKAVLGQGMHPREAEFQDGILTVRIEVETGTVITARRAGEVPIVKVP